MSAGRILDGARVGASFTARPQVVVVGSGAGGANVALRLCELGVDTLLLEMGAAYESHQFSSEDAVAVTQLWRESGTRVAMGNVSFLLPGANALGGATVINAGICFRPPRSVTERWVQDDGIEWAVPERFDPVVDWVWQTMGVAPVPEPFLGAHNQQALAMMRGAGWQAGIIERNAPGCVGCGVCYFGCPSGGKRSVDKAQIATAVAEYGLNVLTRARVEKVIVRARRARGVEGVLLDADGHTVRGRFRVDAAAVVLAAGGIDTPVLLQRSGLGGPAEGIGGQLHVHPGIGVIGYFPEKRLEIWKGVPQGAYSDEHFDDHMLYESSNLPASGFYVMGAKLGEDPTEWMRKYAHISLTGAMFRDESPATVTAAPLGKALVRYRVSEVDLARYRRALQRLGEAYMAAGAAAIMPNLVGVGMVESLPEFRRIVEAATTPRKFLLYASHPHASVPMHASPKRGALSPRFSLHKVPNLYVADASIFPRALGVNPQITIMAAGRIAGDFVAADLG